MNCPNCNAPLEDNAKFCENCGAPVAAPEVAPMAEMLAPAIQVQKKASTVKWIVIAVVGVLIIAGISVGLYFKMQADKKVEAYSEQISLGEKYLEELKYDDAIIAFTKAIEIEPKKEKPYFALVDVYIDIKDTEKANEIIAQIETLFPENVDVVDKQEEVAVIVGEIKVEEEKKKAEEEAAKKAKELKWIVPPDREYLALEPVEMHRYEEKYGGGKRVDYTKDVLIMTKLRDETRENSFLAIESKYSRSGIGLLDYYGNVLFEPIEETAMAYCHGFVDSRKRKTNIVSDIIDADGKFLDIHPDHGHRGYAVYILDTEYINDYGHAVDGNLEMNEYGVMRANQTDVRSVEENPPRMYVAIGLNNKRITQDIYEDGFLGTENNICVCKDGKWGFLNTIGEEIIPFEYDNAYYFQDGLGAVCKDGKWGYIEADGTVYKDFQFEEALPPYEGKAWVKYNGKWGVLDVTADGSAGG